MCEPPGEVACAHGGGHMGMHPALRFTLYRRLDHLIWVLTSSDSTRQVCDFFTRRFLCKESSIFVFADLAASRLKGVLKKYFLFAKLRIQVTSACFSLVVFSKKVAIGDYV